MEKTFKNETNENICTNTATMVNYFYILCNNKYIGYVIILVLKLKITDFILKILLHCFQYSPNISELIKRHKETITFLKTGTLTYLLPYP